MGIKLNKSLKKQLKQALKTSASSTLHGSDKQILQLIIIRTREKNLNNITRTKAYLDFYLKHPEVHWALLAHLVSRNAGWNMSDLKGEHLPKLLTRKEQVDFFSFLERGNWLIFQDAYPQLLLYEKSKSAGRPLTHLLPALGVSSFMKPIWDNFYHTTDSALITKALIINEQHYIENRVIQNELYKNTVLDKILFKLQDLFDLNHILFPYETPIQHQQKLMGHVVHHFSLVDERIHFGKELYDLLYAVGSRHKQIVSWVSQVPHTGSRKDYWPQLFHDVRERAPQFIREPHKNPCGANNSGICLYSPKLMDVWGNQTHEEPDRQEWFKRKSQLYYLTSPIKEQDGDILLSYCDTIEKLEFAIFTKNSLIRKEENNENSHF